MSLGNGWSAKEGSFKGPGNLLSGQRCGVRVLLTKRRGGPPRVLAWSIISDVTFVCEIGTETARFLYRYALKHSAPANNKCELPSFLENSQSRVQRKQYPRGGHRRHAKTRRYEGEAPIGEKCSGTQARWGQGLGEQPAHG